MKSGPNPAFPVGTLPLLFLLGSPGEMLNREAGGNKGYTPFPKRSRMQKGFENYTAVLTRTAKKKPIKDGAT